MGKIGQKVVQYGLRGFVNTSGTIILTKYFPNIKRSSQHNKIDVEKLLLVNDERVAICSYLPLIHAYVSCGGS